LEAIFKVHGRAVEKGEHLRDEFGTLCRVEYMALGRLYTRVREFGEYWDSCAEWTPETFALRSWKRVKPRALKKATR
jgi:hypothetical protein